MQGQGPIRDRKQAKKKTAQGYAIKMSYTRRFDPIPSHPYHAGHPFNTEAKKEKAHTENNQRVEETASHMGWCIN
jgi:hypothetical protein